MRNNAILSTMRKTRTGLVLAVFILAFTVHHSAGSQCEWDDVKRIVAVGDIHGDYEAFIKILEGTGIIDDELNWIGKETHLVQIGDVLDRGPDAKKIFDLLMKLEKEAKKAGGDVHMLIGNHEEMNIANIAFDREDYVTLSQFVDFLPNGYRKRLEKKFRKQLGDNHPKEPESDSSEDGSLRPFWEKLLDEVKNKRDHPARRAYSENFNRKYGKWIVKQNAVIRINNIIFVHGGISEKFSEWGLRKINNRLRVELQDLRWSIMNSSPPRIEDYQREILYEPDGPYWFRGFANENILKETLDTILENLKADYMVIAHTPQVIKTREDMQRFDGRIWIIDTGISEYYRGKMQGGIIGALVIENGEFIPWGFNDEK